MTAQLLYGGCDDEMMLVDHLVQVLRQWRNRVDPDDLPSDNGYELELRWTEEAVYWEGGHGFVMDLGWGVEPPVLYVPSAGLWDRVVPPCRLGRRAGVLSRLAQHSKHAVQDTDNGYLPEDGLRSVMR